MAPGPCHQGRRGGAALELLLIPSGVSISGTGFPYEKVVQRVLYLQVLDYDRFSRNDPIGEVSIPLNKVDLTQMQTFWKDLKPCSDGSVRPWTPSHPPVPAVSQQDPTPSPNFNTWQRFFFLFPSFILSSPKSHFGSNQTVSGRPKMKVFSSCLQQDRKMSHWGWPRFLLPRFFPCFPKPHPRAAPGGGPTEQLRGPWGCSGHACVPQGSRGELLLSLCYNPSANSIVVNIIKARNLKAMDIGGTSGTAPAPSDPWRHSRAPSRG